jgi:peptide chain release factor 1
MDLHVAHFLKRLKEVEELLGDPQTFSNQKAYRELTQEHAFLTQIREAEEALSQISHQQEESQLLLKSEKDPVFIEIIQKELERLSHKKMELQKSLENLLVPPDPNDNRNFIIEIRAGTGGDEAALFVGDCIRMYRAFADKKGWRYEHLSSAPSEKGGFKEYIFSLSGPQAYRLLQYEAGTHRVQRVPETEAQGRVHTSAVTVAVLLEPEEGQRVVLEESELKIDTYRASGAGGQHVNVTDSAVRITHLPTGIVVTCQEERSQHKNREKAMRLLIAKIADERQKKAHQERATLRSTQVGSGDRSERIRTYNFPQNRVTDHRIDLTLYSLDRVMEGQLDEIVEALVLHFYQEKLQQLK